MFKKKTALPTTSINCVLQNTKARLETRKKVEIIIPKDQLNSKDDTVEVAINGYTYVIKRGEEVLVPDVVKRILKRAKILP